MLWITLILALLIALSALGYVLWPLVSQDAPLLPVEDSRLADLLARKDTALRAIKDLEFDYQVGKISDEDYQPLRNRLNRQAITLLQQLERLTPESATLDSALEVEIAKLRRVQPGNRAEAEEPGIQSVPAQSTTSQSTTVKVADVSVAATVRYCTECGTKVDPSFKFCANCGAPIARLNGVAVNPEAVTETSD